MAFTTQHQPLQTFNQQNYAQLTLDGSSNTNQTNIQTSVGQAVQMQTSPTLTTSPAKPNIDLGAIVRSTIINGVTKTFTQVGFFAFFMYVLMYLVTWRSLLVQVSQISFGDYNPLYQSSVFRFFCISVVLFS